MPFIFALLLASPLLSQSLNFGDISSLEVLSTKDSKFSDARAVILYRNVDSYLGNYAEVQERIKIYTEEGYDYATVYIPYRDIKNIKGATYNWVNGKIEVTELEEDLIVKDEIQGFFMVRMEKEAEKLILTKV